MAAKEYTIGIPVATVIFAALTIAAYAMLGSAMPSDAELREESVAVVADLRTRAVEFIPPDNADPLTVQLYADAETRATVIRIHGMLDRDHQSRTLELLDEIRAERNARPIIVHFHYPESVPQRADGTTPVPSSQDRPGPFRSERL